MARQDAVPNPLAQGKGRVDEVDQSRGIFPLGTPHPPDAEMRAPGSLGGGPYEESGRGGPGVSLEEPSAIAGGAGAAQEAAQPDEAAPEGERAAKETEPKGALPAHEERRR